MTPRGVSLLILYNLLVNYEVRCADPYRVSCRWQIAEIQDGLVAVLRSLHRECGNCIQRNVFHPALIYIWFHGEPNAFQIRMIVNKCP